MDLLVIWSKPQSKIAAEALHSWLPTVIPGIKPWMSSKDIAKGREWFRELQGVLEHTRVCIICVTAENVRSPWIYFEAGAIAAKGPKVLICPYLVGVSQSMLADGPLGEWQCTIADQGDTWELIKSLNSSALVVLDVSLLKRNFSARWPDFAAQIK
ncbi:MAG: TIR domain-containing protein, partial [Terriglobia bacterium]